MTKAQLIEGIRRDVPSDRLFEMLRSRSDNAMLGLDEGNDAAIDEALQELTPRQLKYFREVALDDERLKILEEMAKVADAVIRFITIEKCSIRDGDGTWHGIHEVAGMLSDLVHLHETLMEMRA